MKYENITQAIFLKRPNRFITEVVMDGHKEIVHVKNAPLFLRQAREIMGDEEFFACLKDIYNTYSWKIADTKGIIDIFRAHDSSGKLSELISFYFTGM